MNHTRIEYLESLLPTEEDKLDKKYWTKFEKYATYKGNGVYQWVGIVANCTRELWLMGVLHYENVEFEQI